MAKAHEVRDPRRYRIGIDVGTNSVGLAAIEFDREGRPAGILSAISQIHDGGVLEAKTATTRLAAAGVARRMRRLRRRRSKRLVQLDRALEKWGWVPLPDDGDPYQVWRVRARLATEPILDPSELGAHLATALRHMARHRGWRSPYTRAAVFYEPVEPSEYFDGKPATEKRAEVLGFRQRVEQRTGRMFDPSVTVAELATAALELDHHVPLRMGKTERKREERGFSYFGGKLHQGDNANELHTYAHVQGISQERMREIIDLVFAAESPRGSWVAKIGKDPLTGEPRATKASDAFQRFRIVSVLANVRIRDGGVERKLERDELVRAYEYIINLKAGGQPTWGDLAGVIDKPRRAMAGVAGLNPDSSERLPARPPVHDSDQRIRQNAKLSSFRDYWQEADPEARDALIALVVDGLRDESTAAGASAWEFLSSLDEAELSKLDDLDVVAGRAAYSVSSLRKLTAEMLRSGCDLHEARKTVFGVGDDWIPPSEPIGAPIGHPSVDRVLKIIARFVLAAEAEWGTPERVSIEHVRDAFRSEAAVREADRDNQRRFQAKLEQRESVGKSVKSEGRITESDVRRFEAIQRQNGQCLYCGNTITFGTCEMDHIVPRKGVGSTNTRVNLAAVCPECNRSKSNIPFAVWASASPRPGVLVEDAVERLSHWKRDQGMTAKRWAIHLSEVRDRLERREADPEIDARSMESVAWMANEIRDRIAAHFRGTNVSSGAKQVFVYQGRLTAEARRAAGVEDRIPWIGGGGKTRLDRRHHAVDAAVLTLLDESIARTLAERDSLRYAERMSPKSYRDEGRPDWKEYSGSSPQAQVRYGVWLEDMRDLAGLLSTAFEQDRVVVAQSLRLRFGSGRIHEDTINPFVRRPLGGAFARDEIDAAATPQLWTALTRLPEFDADAGLPENPDRRIRVQGTWFGPEDEIELFGKGQARAFAGLAVRGGWAYLGAIHHARIYRWEEKGKPRYAMLRVFTADLLRHRHKDLFAVDPDPSWISMRMAHPSIGRRGVADKEYLGWLVPGDEVLVSANPPVSPSLGVISRWRISGFEDNGRLNVKPAYLAREGLDRAVAYMSLEGDVEADLRELVDGKGRRTVSAFFGESTKPIVIRRDALGRPRLTSAAHLPVSWSP